MKAVEERDSYRFMPQLSQRLKSALVSQKIKCKYYRENIVYIYRFRKFSIIKPYKLCQETEYSSNMIMLINSSAISSTVVW